MKHNLFLKVISLAAMVLLVLFVAVDVEARGGGGEEAAAVAEEAVEVVAVEVSVDKELPAGAASRRGRRHLELAVNLVGHKPVRACRRVNDRPAPLTEPRPGKRALPLASRAARMLPEPVSRRQRIASRIGRIPP